MPKVLVSIVVAAVAAIALAGAGGCSITSACNLGLTDCGNGSCVSLASDVYNCGACGHTCASGTFCSNGACATAGGVPVITSVEVPTFVDPNADGSYTLDLVVWFTDDAVAVDAFDFSSAAATLSAQPITPPASTGSVAITVTLPSGTPSGTFDFTLDVSAGATKSAAFGDSVVLR